MTTEQIRKAYDAQLVADLEFKSVARKRRRTA